MRDWRVSIFRCFLETRDPKELRRNSGPKAEALKTQEEPMFQLKPEGKRKRKPQLDGGRAGGVPSSCGGRGQPLRGVGAID